MPLFKNAKHRTAADNRDEQVTAERAAESAARVSEEAECCLAEIDEVLAEVESEEDRARREGEELLYRLDRGEIDWDRYEEEKAAWRARYAHLLHDCGCGCGWA